ncbi:anaerobic sulfatase maturase [Vibrio rhizosphaerae]|uniref:Anaerobic sulfatase maturase n=1 Tax=Vibrio rhizosphaerae TaxID=398736 RepID=A0ABU4IYT7_9VIBR|nr:anaerobic sulfatase maturase [Vibrio rhizosphaerae]MDW6093891.1 anaerobic sulfatase maturase [Vibrio rhizosphaerae]
MQNQIENFQLLSKPTGSVCNIDCEYCFYLEKEKLYPSRKQNWQMDEETLQNYVKTNIESQSAPVIDFIWQGGEPTLAGLAFFEKAVAYQQRYAQGKQINNFFQTNGLNLTPSWAKFFHRHQFLIGLSIDGNAEHHNRYRRTKSGKNTYDKVIEAIELLKKYQVEFNTLTVVSEHNVHEPLEVYRALKAIGSHYMQFIPLVERIANQADANGLFLIKPDFSDPCQVAPWTVPSAAYGHFLNTIFDEWQKHDIGQYFVMNFEQTMTQLIGGKGSCVFSEECGANLALEANGDVYSCDHFVFPDNKLGNIHHNNLLKMVNSEQQLQFSQSKSKDISVDCLHCPVKAVCHGGCPKHRFSLSSNGIPNKNYLCDGYKVHFSHCVPPMKEIIRRVLQSA